MRARRIRRRSATIKKNLSDVGGIAVDSSGNVYVANGSGGDVLEYAPGAASLVQTYSKGLADPSDVAVANGTLYVADRGNAANGYAQQVLEYPVGNGTPSLGIAGIGNPPDDNEGIAVNPTAKQGTFFASASTAERWSRSRADAAAAPARWATTSFRRSG